MPAHAYDGSAWVVDGQPIDRAPLRRRVGEVLDEVGASRADGDALSFVGAERALRAAADAVEAALEETVEPVRVRALVAHQRAIHDVQRELAAGLVAARAARHAQAQDALGRLREMAAIDQLLTGILAEVLTLGFSRAILSRVKDGRWEPEAVVVDGDPEWAAQILEAGRAASLELDHMVLETEMVRRRMPMLVADVQTDARTHRPIALASLSRSYVTAPIMPEGRVIGFVHADCYLQQRNVDEFDRDLLWLFCEGAGYAFERVVAAERLTALRERVRSLTGEMRAVVDEVIDAEVELARLDRQTDQATRVASRTLVRPDADSRLLTLLTRRELEVARLMTEGHTNAEIARRLVVSPGTIKTHVSSILRKLRVTNRGQAIATLLRLSAVRYPDEGR